MRLLMKSMLTLVAALNHARADVYTMTRQDADQIGTEWKAEASCSVYLADDTKCLTSRIFQSNFVYRAGNLVTCRMPRADGKFGARREV